MAKASAPTVRRPKTTCCVSSTRCGRCPIRLLKEGNLPDGYDVKKRRLVREPAMGPAKITKSELETAVRRTTKARRKQARKDARKAARDDAA